MLVVKISHGGGREGRGVTSRRARRHNMVVGWLRPESHRARRQNQPRWWEGWGVVASSSSSGGGLVAVHGVTSRRARRHNMVVGWLRPESHRACHNVTIYS